jgi:hypothetical protein
MKRLAPLAFALVFAPPASADLPQPRMRAQVIDAQIKIGYGLAIADVDGDGRVDILLADARQVVWYRAPKWEKFVMAENLTEKDNVCIAARDLDGDGKAEVAVGAEWNPNDTLKSGAVFLLEAPSDRTARWTPRRLPHDPTTHRMHWVRVASGWTLAVLPLHGRGNRNGEGEGVRVLGYEWPWREGSVGVPLASDLPPLHLTHNFDLLPAAGGQQTESLLVAAKEGVLSIEAPANRSTPQRFTAPPAGEVRRGTLPDGARFIATIEPMHGNQVVVYRGSSTQHSSGADWTPTRNVVDESLNQGHGLAAADLLGVGHDQIVAGWRGTRPGDRVGIRLYAPVDQGGREWRQHAVIDDNTMACEDLKVADLDGDGRPEVIAAGRASHNVVIYWNETPRR